MASSEDFTNQILNNVTFLEKCNKDWPNILREVKGDKKVTKEYEYARIFDGEDGVIEVLLTASKVLARLKARITIILRKREQMALQAT